MASEERRFAVLENKNLTEGERADAANYASGDVLLFHQNAKGLRKGHRIAVDDKPLPLEHAGKFHVFHESVLALAPGDVVRITRNGTTADGEHRLNNGALHTVTGFDQHGDIVLANGWTIDQSFGHLAYGYVVTSHASQGKTVDACSLARPPFRILHRRGNSFTSRLLAVGKGRPFTRMTRNRSLMR